VVIADRSEFRGARFEVRVSRFEFRGSRFEEDKTDQQVVRATNRRLACDRYMTLATFPAASNVPV